MKVYPSALGWYIPLKSSATGGQNLILSVGPDYGANPAAITLNEYSCKDIRHFHGKVPTQGLST